MAKEELEQSFATLKQTLPLLIKHQLPAVPLNYALWYTYVTNQNPALVEQLDQAVAGNQPLSKFKSQDLYRQHIASADDVSIHQLRQSLESMLIELNQSMKDTRTDTIEYKQNMDKCLDDLNRVEQEGWSLEEVMGLIRSMVKDAQAVRASTMSFNKSLANAEDEISRLRQQLAESQQAALYDALTGLCNRRYFDSEVESKTNMERLSLLLIDIDHFKKINDNHGHQTGDAVLKAVGRKLQQTCREQAQAFRYGGEEFAILLPNRDLAAALRFAETVRKQIEKLSVKNRRNGDVLNGITISIGAAEIDKKEKADAFIERADGMLYKAKKLGRNRVMPIHA